ncbi:hypothetical protein AA0113_g10467 [Alternaria arborescens]|uniref:Uncharacterized protein n=1 Tax=Alternaria arborescens TaxID=156630 RepID=A0A4V1X0F0_9PLEO|nr:hypothetical protein AA0111_g12011 [Alternaria arborescens]RYO14281.1 hypothetical protein AA0111_g12011 [Alternaria arborescens]RYO45258.1 hypothetical protein AA0113_g10467 [Alternaria arborescens]
MAWLPPTSPATLRASKRTCEEDIKDFPKRQCRTEFQTLTEATSDVNNNYSGELSETTPQSSSSLFPVQSAHPERSDTRLPDINEIAVGHEVSHYNLYAPARTYRDLNEQHGLTVPFLPPPASQRSYDYASYPHQYHSDELPMSVLGLSVPHVPPDQGQYYPLDSSIAINPQVHEQPIEERLILALTAAGYGQDVTASTSAEQAAWQDVYTRQNIWLFRAEADLQGHTIEVVPGIPTEQGALGSSAGINHDLIPTEVWFLRSLSPLLRYSAYRMMTEEAHEMITYDQASEEFQRRWAWILNFQAFLLWKEKEWVGSFQQIVDTHRRRCWDQKVEEQAIETPVNQAMIDTFKRSKMEARGAPLVGVTLDNETPQVPPSESVPVAEQPATRNNTTEKFQSPISHSDIPSILPERLHKPDMIKHPLDKIAVPSYPFDKISDFTPNGEGIYQCMHRFGRKWPCCKNGLDEQKMKQAIYRSISTWKSQVERLIENGDLHRSHMTWPTHQNQALKRAHIAAERQRAETESGNGEVEAERIGNEDKKQKQKRLMDNTAKVSQGKNTQLGLQQELLEEDATSESSSVSTLNLHRQYEATAPKLSPDVVVAQLVSDWNIARINIRDKQEFDNCLHLEQGKKWPKWPRFKEWWAARLSQVEFLQLSQDQKIVLKRPEPSSIADDEAAFVEKTKESLPLDAQGPADTEENTDPDGSDLDGLFDDGDETNLQET